MPEERDSGRGNASDIKVGTAATGVDNTWLGKSSSTEKEQVPQAQGTPPWDAGVSATVEEIPFPHNEKLPQEDACTPDAPSPAKIQREGRLVLWPGSEDATTEVPDPRPHQDPPQELTSSGPSHQTYAQTVGV